MEVSLARGLRVFLDDLFESREVGYARWPVVASRKLEERARLGWSCLPARGSADFSVGSDVDLLAARGLNTCN